LDTRSFRVLWALEELSLLYELHVLPFPPRQLAKSIFDVNPLGTVPALVVDGTVVTESVAIVYYLDLVSRGEGSPLAVPPQEQDYGVWLIIKWLSFGGATLTFPQESRLQGCAQTRSLDGASVARSRSCSRFQR
jgi:glutathione S-transferase